MNKVKKLVVVPVELEKTVYKKPASTPKRKAAKVTPEKKRATKPKAQKKKVSWTIVD
jgi:hypothetical protein